MINIIDICKKYNNEIILNKVNLNINRGECIYLVGPSGSGKTTLLSIIGCLLTQDSGIVKILNRNILLLNSFEKSVLRRDKIGFVFQKHHLIKGISAIENVCIPMILQGKTLKKAKEEARILLNKVNLNDNIINQKQMSLGQYQRVALARALINDPEIILADEPTASLDAINGQEIMHLIKSQHKTVIVVTHDQRILHFADKIFYLENGNIVK